MPNFASRLRDRVVSSLRVHFPTPLRLFRTTKHQASNVALVDENRVYAQLIELTSRARQMTERNRQLEKLIVERKEEKAANNETYKKQALFHQYLMFDVNPQMVLNAILRKAAFGEPSSCPIPPREI